MMLGVVALDEVKVEISIYLYMYLYVNDEDWISFVRSFFFFVCLLLVYMYYKYDTIYNNLHFLFSLFLFFYYH